MALVSPAESQKQMDVQRVYDVCQWVRDYPASSGASMARTSAMIPSSLHGSFH